MSPGPPSDAPYPAAGSGREGPVGEERPEATALDAVIHERMRLAIVTALAAHDVLSFTELKRLLNLTDGNLSVHARRLEESGYVSAVKVVDGRATRTDFRLTPAGRKALAAYLTHMESIVRATRDALG